MTVIGTRRVKVVAVVVATALAVAACTGDAADDALDSAPDPTTGDLDSGAADSSEPDESDESDEPDGSTLAEDERSTDAAPVEQAESDEEPPEPGRPQPADGVPTADSGLWLGRGAMSEGGIELVWSDLDGAERYRIHRFSRDEVADPDTPELTEASVIHDTAGNDGLLDETVEAGARYWYVLVAYDGDDEPIDRRWTKADAVTDDEPPIPVTGLAATVEDGQVALTWNPSEDNYRFERYAIRRSVDGEPSVYYGTGWTIDQTSFIDDAPPGSGTVVYEVIATDFHDNLAEAAVVAVSL